PISELGCPRESHQCQSTLGSRHHLRAPARNVPVSRRGDGRLFTASGRLGTGGELTRGVRFALGLTAADPMAFPAAPYFDDVPADHQFFGYIQKMKQRAFTSGCTTTSYCPNDQSHAARWLSL